MTRIVKVSDLLAISLHKMLGASDGGRGKPQELDDSSNKKRNNLGTGTLDPGAAAPTSIASVCHSITDSLSCLR